jgi:Protein of unknown function (DUF1173)
MSQVSAVGHVFSTEDYENAPLFYARSLEKAKIEVGHALCLCTKPNPHLVVRRVGSKSGDRFFLATWPNKGTEHAPSCRFYHSEDEYELDRAKRLAAIMLNEHGFSIKPDFTLKRTIAEAKKPASREPNETQHPRTQRDTMGLLGTLEYLWQTAGLNQWQHSSLPGNPARWTNLVTRLTSVLAQGLLGKQSLLDITYVVPAFEVAKQDEISAHFGAIVDRHKKTAEVSPSFLVIGEVKTVESTAKSVRVHLRHHPRALYMFPSLGNAIAARYPIAEALLNNPDGRDCRVIGLFLVDVTDKGNLWVRDAALMACSREYIPCDSSHEIRLANQLTNARRAFVKPLRLEYTDDLLPDFKLMDAHKPISMEVWGMNTPEYNAHRDEKINRYRARGEALWEWEAWRTSNIPVIPLKSS